MDSQNGNLPFALSKLAERLNTIETKLGLEQLTGLFRGARSLPSPTIG